MKPRYLRRKRPNEGPLIQLIKLSSQKSSLIFPKAPVFGIWSQKELQNVEKERERGPQVAFYEYFTGFGGTEVRKSSA